MHTSFSLIVIKNPTHKSTFLDQYFSVENKNNCQKILFNEFLFYIRRKRSQKGGVDEGAWDCSVCTFKNNPEAFKCAMCDVRKGTSTRKPRLNPDVVAAQHAQALTPPPPPFPGSIITPRITPGSSGGFSGTTTPIPSSSKSPALSDTTHEELEDEGEEGVDDHEEQQQQQQQQTAEDQAGTSSSAVTATSSTTISPAKPSSTTPAKKQPAKKNEGASVKKTQNK